MKQDTSEPKNNKERSFVKFLFSRGEIAKAMAYLLFLLLLLLSIIFPQQRSSLMMVASSVGFIIAALILKGSLKNRNDATIEFNKILCSKIENGFFYDKEDIEILVNSINSDTDLKCSIKDYLENFLSEIGYNKSCVIDKGVFLELKKILEKEKKERPFMDVPEQEKRLMINIDNCLEKNDPVTAKYNLTELSSVIIANHKANKKIEKTNRWSVPLAIIGIAVSILFGVYTVWCNFDEKSKTSETESVQTEQHDNQTKDSLKE